MAHSCFAEKLKTGQPQWKNAFTCLEYSCRSIFNGWVVRKFVYSKPPGRKMITADINAIIFITGNITVIVNCVGIVLRTIFGPLSKGWAIYQQQQNMFLVLTHIFRYLFEYFIFPRNQSIAHPPPANPGDLHDPTSWPRLFQSFNRSLQRCRFPARHACLPLKVSTV